MVITLFDIAFIRFLPAKTRALAVGFSIHCNYAIGWIPPVCCYSIRTFFRTNNIANFSGIFILCDLRLPNTTEMGFHFTRECARDNTKFFLDKFFLYVFFFCVCILTVHRAFHLILALYFTLANMLINCISHFGWERASVCVCEWCDVLFESVFRACYMQDIWEIECVRCSNGRAKKKKTRGGMDVIWSEWKLKCICLCMTIATTYLCVVWMCPCLMRM